MHPGQTIPAAMSSSVAGVCVGDDLHGLLLPRPASKSLFQTQLMSMVAMENSWTNKPMKCDGRVQALSAHYIMLIRPPQALPLVRIYRKLFLFLNIFFKCKACLHPYVICLRKKKCIGFWAGLLRDFFKGLLLDE